MRQGLGHLRALSVRDPMRWTATPRESFPAISASTESPSASHIETLMFHEPYELRVRRVGHEEISDILWEGSCAPMPSMALTSKTDRSLGRADDWYPVRQG